MHKTKTFYPFLGILVFISVVLFILSKQGMLQSIPFLNTMMAPLQKGLFSGVQHLKDPNAETQLQQENKKLIQKLAQYKRLEQDNAALRDQFQISKIPTKHLLPVHIVGEPGFVADSIETVIIDKGSQDGVRNGMVIIYKDNLLGKVMRTTNGFSQVAVISNDSISFSAKTLQTNALGVIKGQGSGGLIFDNVLLNQTLKTNDIVVTNGDLDINGNGYPPDLIVGKITGIQKVPSALFQKANITALVDITRLSMVFVMIQK
ncbi:MAG TPA: rod shape-determining protein MreC [Candidatus Saccharimonadales bacterium]|nr:rod shape-determining protein MreC [Candidatus Saccharimonadales bacterium]